MERYDIGNRIYELRKEKGISQKELGELLGVSNKSVSKWETGSALPKTETLVKLAEVLEISSEELLQGTTNDKRTLSKLSAEANQYFLQEELNQRDKIEKSKEVKARKRYIAICITVFISVFTILTLLSISEILINEDGGLWGSISNNLLLSYIICGALTGVIFLVRIIQQLDMWRIIIACILFPLTLVVALSAGEVMLIPELIKSIKIIGEDKNGPSDSKQNN